MLPQLDPHIVKPLYYLPSLSIQRTSSLVSVCDTLCLAIAAAGPAVQWTSAPSARVCTTLHGLHAGVTQYYRVLCESAAYQSLAPLTNHPLINLWSSIEPRREREEDKNMIGWLVGRHT